MASLYENQKNKRKEINHSALYGILHIIYFLGVNTNL